MSSSPRASRPGADNDEVVARGSQANKQSWGPAISADGRYVAFASEATNLVPGDTNRSQDVFVRDRETHRTVRISVNSRGVQSNSESYRPSISADGRIVAFISWATNLVSGDTNKCLAVAADYPGCADAFVHDMKTGSTSRASVSSSGRQANQRTEYVVISRNGRFVAFSSWATTLVAGDTNECSEGSGADQPPGCPDIFVRDLTTHTTERVTIAPDGSQFQRGGTQPSISDDGSKVGFILSDATEDTSEAYVRDRAARQTVRVPFPEGVSTYNGQRDGVLTGAGKEMIYKIDVGSPPGCRPQFAPPGEQICTSFHQELYVYNLAARTTERITPRSSSGADPNGELNSLSVSSDGRFVVFSSDASNLVRDDGNRKVDVFLFDRVRKSVSLVSVSTRESQANGDSGRAAVSSTGRTVTFESQASNLVSADTNRAGDVFVRDVAAGSTSRVSVP